MQLRYGGSVPAFWIFIICGLLYLIFTFFLLWNGQNRIAVVLMALSAGAVMLAFRSRKVP